MAILGLKSLPPFAAVAGGFGPTELGFGFLDLVPVNSLFTH